MATGIRVIGGAGGDALSVDSGSLLVKPYTPGSPYTQWYIVSATSTAFENGYWVSTTGCRGFRVELNDTATWTACSAYCIVAFDTSASRSSSDLLDKGASAIATPAHTALPNTLFLCVQQPSTIIEPIEVWVSGDTRIKTIAMKADSARRIKLTTWI